MITADKGKIVVYGNGEEIGTEASMILISIYKENRDLFKDVIEFVTELIESGEVDSLGRRVPYEPNKFSGDR